LSKVLDIDDADEQLSSQISVDGLHGHDVAVELLQFLSLTSDVVDVVS